MADKIVLEKGDKVSVHLNGVALHGTIKSIEQKVSSVALGNMYFWYQVELKK